MSRYTATLENGRTIAWGYDRLGEYFLSEFRTPEESEQIAKDNADKEEYDYWDDEEVVFSIMSKTTTACHPDYPEKLEWSNDEMAKLMLVYPANTIPVEHIQAVRHNQQF
jgi:hypothetical protein